MWAAVVATALAAPRFVGRPEDVALAEAACGAKIRAVLDGGAASQRAALQDEDLDALSDLYEALAGTDPTRWDTDGDGWWDGATPVPGAVPLPRNGRPVCLAEVPRGTARVVVEYGGQLGGVVLPTVPKVEGARPPERVAAEIVALHASVGLPAHARSAAALAMLRGIDAKPAGLLVAYPTDVRAWERAAERCASGWEGLLEGSCEGPR